MGLLGKLRGLFTQRGTETETAAPAAGGEAQRVFAQIIAEAIAGDRAFRSDLSQSVRWQELKSDPGELQVKVLELALPTATSGLSAKKVQSWAVREARRQMVSQLLRRNLPIPAASLESMVAYARGTRIAMRYADIPLAPLLGAVERHAARDGLSKAMLTSLARLRDKLIPTDPRFPPSKFDIEAAQRIDALIDPAAAADRPPIPPGAFADAFVAAFGKGSPEWEALAAHATTAGDKSAPSAKWLNAARPLLAAVGNEAFTAALKRWLGAIVPDPAMPDPSLDTLKGMIWLAPLVAVDGLAGTIGRFAETCFRKVSGIGARSVKLGNAALYALSEMADEPAAGAELFRLRGAIKYPSARTMLDKRIAALAANSGSSVEALEDAALPDFGLAADGTLERRLGDFTARLTVSATGTELAWTSAEGKPLKGPPVAAKRDHKAELTALTLLAKDIEKARAAQARRLEDGWLEARSWTLGEWRKHYHEHPLRRPLIEALIWQASDGAKRTAFRPTTGGMEDVAGTALKLPDSARVTLWHPLDAEPEAVLAWRARIMALELTQPIKQAHREIYVLTDAELVTETYSNRFAAHVLRQHQFRALCQARDWRYDLMGFWDGHNVPNRTLPALGLRVEYMVEGVEDGQLSPSAVMLYLATDQVRFVNTATNQPIPLVELDRIVFSELMRDVDLFVAVTSVAADPNWQDGGPDGRFANYWHDWAFGELGQSAQTRKALIAAIAPRLSIADKLEIGDKALIVTGKRQKYAIHFGSANIQILPANRYLCIVPDRSPAETDKIRLPFTGDSQLSTILAKAFLLVDESKITDPTILRQL